MIEYRYGFQRVGGKESLIWRINVWAVSASWGGGKQDGDNLSGKSKSQKIELIS